jgi:transposase
VNTIEAAVKGERRRRRRHSDEFKANLVAACSRPGVSIASVALANGINANLLRRWMIEQGGQRLPMPEPAESTTELPRDQVKAAFVAVRLDATPPPATSDIRIELKRGATTVVVSWPSSAAAASAAWLREILR